LSHSLGKGRERQQAVALDDSRVREIIGRVFARREVPAACRRRDLGEVIRVLGAHGVTQGKIAELTGLSQGRLSEWAGGKRAPRATSTFESFADGLVLPADARQALGLAPKPGTPVTAAPGHSSGLADSPLPVQRNAVITKEEGASSGGLAGLRGLEPVQDQLRGVLAILEAERGRERGGWSVRRRAWKNLVFTGGAGSGKSRAGAAVARAYCGLGLLASERVHEIAAVDLSGASAAETGTLMGKAFEHAAGGVLMINGAGDWHGLTGRGQLASRQLYMQLTEYRDVRAAKIAVILTGEKDPLLKWLHGYPQLAARFLAVVDFPGYAPGQLSAVFGELADDAGLRLTIAARRKAAAVLELAGHGEASGNARLAVRLLNEVRAVQARRLSLGHGSIGDLPELVTITEADIPECLLPDGAVRDDDRPGPYL